MGTQREIRTVLSFETVRPITIHELNEFFTQITLHLPGCAVSQGPAGRGQVSVIILTTEPITLDTTGVILDGVPDLRQAITTLTLDEGKPRRTRLSSNSSR